MKIETIETIETIERIKDFKGFNQEQIEMWTTVEYAQETINRILDISEMKKRGNPKMTLDEKYYSAIASLVKYTKDMQLDPREIEERVKELSLILKIA